MSNFSDVGDFHEKFGLHRSDQGRTPEPVTDELIKFRVDFMQEELDEFKKGCLENDQAQMFDALLDLVYVAMGTAHLLNYPWQRGWEEVQRANMTKVRAAKDGSNSKRGSSFDVVKPEGWQPPDIEGVLFGREQPLECPMCGRAFDGPAVDCELRPHRTTAYCGREGYYIQKRNRNA